MEVTSAIVAGLSTMPATTRLPIWSRVTCRRLADVQSTRWEGGGFVLREEGVSHVDHQRVGGFTMWEGGYTVALQSAVGGSVVTLNGGVGVEARVASQPDRAGCWDLFGFFRCCYVIFLGVK
jgi:hypothetical protein